MGSPLTQALAMIDAFTSVGARSFDLTILDLDGNKVPGLQRPRSSLAELRRTIARTLENAERHQYNVIIRPRSTGPRLIQLDDLDLAKAARAAPYAFIEISTSPGNFQSWLAVSDSPKDQEGARDFARRLKRGAGADPGATAAVRIVGSRNFKRKYAPEFPTIRITRTNPGHSVTVAQLEQAGLVAPREAPIPPPACVPPKPSIRSAADRQWPDYARALSGAPMNVDGSGPDRSKADFMWAKWAIQRGWSIEETAAQLWEVSDRPRERASQRDMGYAEITAKNAAKAVERDRGRPRLRSQSTPGHQI